MPPPRLAKLRLGHRVIPKHPLRRKVAIGLSWVATGSGFPNEEDVHERAQRVKLVADEPEEHHSVLRIIKTTTTLDKISNQGERNNSSFCRTSYETTNKSSKSQSVSTLKYYVNNESNNNNHV